MTWTPGLRLPGWGERPTAPQAATSTSSSSGHERGQHSGGGAREREAGVVGPGRFGALGGPRCAMVAGRLRRGGAGDTAAGRAGGRRELDQELRERSREGGSAGGGDSEPPRNQGSTATCRPRARATAAMGRVGPGQDVPSAVSHTSKTLSFPPSDSHPHPQSSSPILVPSSLPFSRHLRNIYTWLARVPDTWGTTGCNKGKLATPK